MKTFFSLLTLTFLLVLTSGCYGSRRDMAANWAQSVQEAGTFPITLTRFQPIAFNETITLTLTFTDAEHATLNCGNNLLLKLYDPSYLNGKADIYFEDADGDKRADLRFRAILLPENTPMHVIFLYRPTYWEKFILPVDF